MRATRDGTNSFQLFVYGTLKRGGCRHGTLASQRFLGVARTTATYVLHDFGDYPGLVASREGGTAVHGELYEVERSMVGLLDEMEGSPDWFKLEPVALDGIDGAAWAYFYQGAPGDRPRIASGTWGNP